MTSTQLSGDPTTEASRARAVPMRLEVVVLPVTDVDRAKRFYEGLGWRLDNDAGGGNYRVVQMTPPGSNASIIFGMGLTYDDPGSIDSLLLAVDDVAAACDELRSHGADVSEVFHFDVFGGPLVPGPDPQGRPYSNFASFRDPDGNGWLLQEVKTRLPGRGFTADVGTLTELLRETEEHHGQYEPTAPKHHWSGWYAAYIVARERGGTPEEAAKDATSHVEGLRA